MWAQEKGGTSDSPAQSLELLNNPTRKGPILLVAINRLMAIPSLPSFLGLQHHSLLVVALGSMLGTRCLIARVISGGWTKPSSEVIMPGAPPQGQPGS